MGRATNSGSTTRLELRYTINYTIIKIRSTTTKVELTVGSWAALAMVHTHLHLLGEYKQTQCSLGNLRSSVDSSLLTGPQSTSQWVPPQRLPDQAAIGIEA